MFWYDELNPDLPPITIGVYDPNIFMSTLGSAIQTGIFQGQLPMTPGYLVPTQGDPNGLTYINPENGATVDIGQTIAWLGLDPNYYLNLLNTGIYTPGANNTFVNQATGIPINTNQLLGDLGLDVNYFNNLMGAPGGLQFSIAPGASIPGKVTGTDGDDSLKGSSQGDTIEGLNGNDIINGYEDNDVLNSGKGNDIIYGETGNDMLNGGTGQDTMLGGKGNDTYYTDNIKDTIIESPHQGSDTAITSVNYNLPDNVENIMATGKADMFLCGNSLDNQIAGNAGNNNLSGLDGNDTIIGQNATDTLSGGKGNDLLIDGKGNDIIDGGSGIDNMIGGAGNDLYFVDNTSDKVTEKLETGTDTINSTVTYALPQEVENLELTGNKDINGFGNSLDNSLTGNSGDNLLMSKEGNDSLIGGDGNDSLHGGSGNDLYTGCGIRNFGQDIIADISGFDTLDLSSQARTNVTFKTLDINHNGNADSLKINFLNQNNSILIQDYFSDQQGLKPGIGLIEDIQFSGNQHTDFNFVENHLN